MAKRSLDIWDSPVPYDGLGLADITIKAHITKENQSLMVGNIERLRIAIKASIESFRVYS